MPPAIDSKPCVSCGRPITWRKKWERDWDSVKYCSDACRRGKPGDDDRRLEALILEVLAGRAAGATICPSEVARLAAASSDEAAWRALMDPVRRAARRLVATGRLEITQGGRVVDGSTARGAIRLRLARRR